MGATIPIVMLAIRRQFEREASRGFSYLYLSNVLGGMAGSLLPLVLIELYGFRHTLRIGFVLNILLAASALARSLAVPARATPVQEQPAPDFSGPSATSPRMLALLFGTGFTSMGLEVVWIRQFTPYLGSVVYSFASILAVYVAATFAGSQFYRRWGRSVQPFGALLWVIFGLCALFASVTGNPFIQIHRAIRLVFGVGPFSALAGFATPLLVDRWSRGDPDRAGKAYAVNVAGCILGPLVAGFVLLPLLNERTVSFVLALPWLLIGALPGWSPWATSAAVPQSAQHGGRAPGLVWRRVVSYAALLIAVATVLGSRAYEDLAPGRVLLRDNTATVFAATISVKKTTQRMLVVNGVGMTSLNANTKMMAHLPLAYLDHTPRNALAICFGMGTTFRSLLSWNIPTTVVELVPSVPKLFWYFHEDAPQVLGSPLAHVVIDDGRRFLEQTSDRFDVITIDPPPPPEAAASSLLYSKQFYAVARRRLQKGGILQQWLPYGDPVIIASVVRAVQESFPHVKMFHALGGGQRIHFLASEDPLPNRTASELAARLPPSAVRDLMEWGPAATPEQEMAGVVDHEWSFQELVAGAPGTPALDDDQPANEYYWVRREFKKQAEPPQRSASLVRTE